MNCGTDIPDKDALQVAAVELVTYAISRHAKAIKGDLTEEEQREIFLLRGIIGNRRKRREEKRKE